MLRVFKKIVNLIGFVIFRPIASIIPKKRVIILQTYSRQLYCDNTRYLYELLSEKKDIDVYWVTDNLKIKQYITSKDWKYITWHNPIKMIWISIRAKVVVDNGDGYFNIFNLINSNSVVKISLLHGSGPKATLHRTENIDVAVSQILNMNKFNYVNFTSEYSAESIGKMTYFLPNEKILTFGYPRCDFFFNTKLVERLYKDKKVSRLLTPLIDKKDRIILYTPTWRPYEYTFPVSEMPGFSFGKFNEWLQLNNLFFFYTVHSNLTPNDMPYDLDRIVFINTKKYPLFDINEFMLEVDILINDYSTTSTDFSILNRPQVFYMPDYDYYNSEKCFIEPYRNIMPGKEVFNYEDLKKTLLEASLDSKSYVEKYSVATKRLQKKYYDFSFNNSTKKLSEFIQKSL